MSGAPIEERGAAADERALRSAQLVRDRLAGGAPADDPITREALEVMSRELRAFAEGEQHAPLASGSAGAAPARAPAARPRLW
jgi:hypothetical protein